jgi:hypothetical protein
MRQFHPCSFAGKMPINGRDLERRACCGLLYLVVPNATLSEPLTEGNMP